MVTNFSQCIDPMLLYFRHHVPIINCFINEGIPECNNNISSGVKQVNLYETLKIANV